MYGIYNDKYGLWVSHIGTGHDHKVVVADEPDDENLLEILNTRKIESWVIRRYNGSVGTIDVNEIQE